MSIRVLLREQPSRAIALVTPTHALIFRHALPASASSAGAQSNASAAPPSQEPRCIVEFLHLDSVDLRDFKSITPLPVHGTLGLITINNDIFICLITGSARVATLRPGESVQRIHSVDFHCLSSAEYDQVLDSEVNPYPTDTLAEDGREYGHQQGRREPVLEHPCLAVKKLLSSGTFYYSVDFDLTHRLQDRSNGVTVFDMDSPDEGFMWNSYMIEALVQFRSRLNVQDRRQLDDSRILTSAIRGFAETLTIPASISPIQFTKPGLPASLTLLSRLSSRRAGTRFNARGVDDDGNVANFVETELIFWVPGGVTFSYVQVRGSVPIFWEQASGLLPGQQKVQITRSAEATQPAFDKHIEALEVDYGAVHIVNLLSEARPAEAEIADRYRWHIRHSRLSNTDGKGTSSDQELLKETSYDFNAETKGPSGYEAASAIQWLIRPSADAFAYYLSEEVEDPPHGSQASFKSGTYKRSITVLQQEGVFRTNCLDCLDRTNLVQTIISQMALEVFFSHRNARSSTDFWIRHSALWADNGDSLSKIYAGTGALKSSFTRHGKMSLAGAIADARKSATRLYINNFADKGRQNTMDLLLGRLMGQSPVRLYDPVHDYVVMELSRRAAEYTSTKVIHIWVGTFNLNGKASGLNEDLSPWLCPPVGEAQQYPEIVVVGFQEIVELSPQQIMSTDPAIRQTWEAAVKKTLNKHAKKAGKEEYVLLRSGQLVGAALSVFVKVSVLSDVKNVEGSVKKTGLSGMAGNKGAVAIRMDYANTRLCFVTAHLAAGFANYEERNRDYRTINHGLRFQRNRTIEDHDAIIWLGDFNYRIGLSDEKVRQLIQKGDLDQLYANDQLNLQMVAGLSFPYYSEAKITFAPTYKYDNGTDRYDTSEKGRIPAWCDRILCKGTILRQIDYDTAPLRFSDHRPVYATFDCLVQVVDEAKKDQINREIYARRQEAHTTSIDNLLDDLEEEDAIGYDSIAPDLPPASSARRKWWLDNGLPARSNLRAPDVDMVPNPNRTPNPFLSATSGKPDWIQKSNLTTSSQPPRDRAPSQSPTHGLHKDLSTSHETLGGVNAKSPPSIPRKPHVLSSKMASQSTPLSPSSTGHAPHTRQTESMSHRSKFPSGWRTPELNSVARVTYGTEDEPARRPSLPPRNQEATARERPSLIDDAGDIADRLATWKPLHPT